METMTLRRALSGRHFPRALPGRVALTFLLAMLVASAASAQTRARVKQDGTSIWRPGFLNVATVVAAGTELEVVGRYGDWLEVLLPGQRDAPRTRGFIAETAVELSGPVPEGSVAAPGPAASMPGNRPLVPRPSGFAANQVRLFASGGYGWFSARKSFDAMFGARGGAMFGGGVDVQAGGGIFAQVAVDSFRLDGERVFVNEGEVFRLGIRDDVTIVPVHVTAGYRVGRGRFAPYGGAGIGRHFLRDDYDFADADARKFQSFTSYHAVVGVEWWAARRVGTAIELQYSHVPKALDGGIGADLGEDNLGGMHVRAKVMFGK